MLVAMSSKPSRPRRQATPTERPLLAERIQRNPVLKFLGSLMVGQAMWRRNALGEGSVAPTPELLTPDPVESALPDGDEDHSSRTAQDRPA
jgi:hypothetical protein